MLALSSLLNFRDSLPVFRANYFARQDVPLLSYLTRIIGSRLEFGDPKDQLAVLRYR